MDETSNVPEVQRSEHEHSAVRALKQIDPSNWDPKRLQWLWKCILTQDYAIDDPGVALGPQAFLGQLFAPNSEWYEVEDWALVAVSGIIPCVNAIIHFVTWDEFEIADVIAIQHYLFTDMFTRHDLNRITAYIPAFNKQAIRLATISGMRYEGELRKAFLKHGRYHNLQIFGILRDEFFKKAQVS